MFNDQILMALNKDSGYYAASQVTEADEQQRSTGMIVSMLFINYGMKEYDYCERQKQSQKKLPQQICQRMI